MVLHIACRQISVAWCQALLAANQLWICRHVALSINYHCSSTSFHDFEKLILCNSTMLIMECQSQYRQHLKIPNSVVVVAGKFLMAF